jgi:predicted secreted protein
MSLFSGIAIYFIIWWLVLFAVLPIGVRSQHEEGDITLGTDHGAPVRPMLIRKALITSLIAAIIFAGVYVAVAVYGLTLEDLII